MKKRNLILSLVCSIALTVALVVFTVVTIVPKKGSNDVDFKPSSVVDSEINNDRDGSADKPYIIASTDMVQEFLVGKYINQDGEYIDYNEKDTDENYLHPELAEGLHFEVASDIDYAGVDFDTIFNKGMAFNGTIDGKNHTIKNITINVTRENLSNFMYLGSKGYRAHIGLFGKLDGAKITNLKIENIKVNITQEVLDYLRDEDTKFVVDNKNVMYELTVGLFAGLAFDSEINVDIQGSIEGFSYCYREDDKASGTNAIGGLVGSAVNTNITGSVAKTNMTLIGTNYFIGGLVGKAYNVVANDARAELNLSARYNQKIYVGGIAGYSTGIEVNNSQVALNVTESGDRISNDMIGLLSSDSVNETINIAGLVSFIRANDDTQKAIFKNNLVISNIAIDGVYAGAYIEVWSTADKTQKLIILENNKMVSNVDTLKASGIAIIMKNTLIISKLSLDGAGYDFAITGTARLTKQSCALISFSCDDIPTTLNGEGYETLTIILGNSLMSKLSPKDTIILNNLKNANRVEFIDGNVEISLPEINKPETDNSGSDVETDNSGSDVENNNSGSDIETDSGDNTEAA